MCFEPIDVELHSANCVVCLRIIVDFGHNEYSRNRVQRKVTEGQNLLVTSRHYYITPIMVSLLWLPVHFRTDLNKLLITFKAQLDETHGIADTI